MQQCEKCPDIHNAQPQAAFFVGGTKTFHHGGVGVGDGHREMHRLHDVLQFFETSLKNRIVKNWKTSHR